MLGSGAIVRARTLAESAQLSLIEYWRQRTLSRCQTIEELRRAARRGLPRPIWDFLEGGAGEEITLRRNTSAFSDFGIRPRVRTRDAAVDTSVRVLGHLIAGPIITAPAGGAGLFHPAAEGAVAKATASLGLFYTLSMGSTQTIETIGAAISSPKMFQLYPFADPNLNRALVERAKAAGFTALCVTVDCPVPGKRLRDIRNGMGPGQRLSLAALIQFMLHPLWSLRAASGEGTQLGNVSDLMPLGDKSLSAARSFLGNNLARSFPWSDLESLAKRWDGPLAVKGILSPSDARDAVAAGASAIIVSNHGGRQVDGVCASVEALPDIADAIGQKAEVILDGGIRRGMDIVAALALGAKAVMVGRPYLYGLVAGGEEGARHALNILLQELRSDMLLMGAVSLSDLRRELIASRGS